MDYELKLKQQQKKGKDMSENFSDALSIESVETKEVFKRAFKEIENTNPDDVISYGYTWLDDKLSGIFPGQIILIGGESGTGKSTFSISLVYNCKKPTAVFALEERLEDYGKKAIYFEIGRIRGSEGKKQYPWNAYVRGGLNGQQQFLDYVAKAYENFKDRRYPFFQKIDKRITIELVEKRIEVLSKMNGVKLFLIDHLHSFDLISGKNSKADFIEDVMVRLGALARRLNISIIIVAHYRKLNGNRPTLDSFKDSISIVQNSSTVINIWRNRDDGIAEEERYKTQFIISKTRDLGGEGKIDVRFDPMTGKYTDEMTWKIGVPTIYDNKNYTDVSRLDL
jgi:replicative DNA helicase